VYDVYRENKKTILLHLLRNPDVDVLGQCMRNVVFVLTNDILLVMRVS